MLQIHASSISDMPMTMARNSSLNHFPEDQDRSNYLGTLGMYHPFSWIIIHPHQPAHLSGNLDHPLTWSINFHPYPIWYAIIHFAVDHHLIAPFSIKHALSIFHCIWTHHHDPPFAIVNHRLIHYNIVNHTFDHLLWFSISCRSSIDLHWLALLPYLPKSKPQIGYPTMLVGHFAPKERSYF